MQVIEFGESHEDVKRTVAFIVAFPHVGAILTVGKALMAGGNLGPGFAKTGLMASTLTVP